MNTSEKTRLIVRIAMLSAIAVVLSFVELQVPIFPSFLKLDVADIPAIIGAITLGPIPAVTIVFIKNILHGLIGSQSAGVGELANFLIGGALVLPLGVAMRNNKSTRNYIIGAVFGVIFMIISGSLLNVYVLLPMYEIAMNFPIDQVIAISHEINPNVNGIWTYILFIIVPFNLIKGIGEMTLGFILYKALRKPLLKEFSK